MKTKKEELQAELTRLNALRKQVKEKLKALPLLDVGKWYKGTCDFESLIFIIEIENTGSYNNIHGYGFKGGQWNDSSHLFSNTDHEKSLVEATPQEVEQALIEEAKRRYNVGDKLSKVDDDYSKGDRIFSLNLSHQSVLCDLWIDNDGDRGHSSCIFKNGKWATIIEQDKFAELKEAHRNGAKIQINNIYGGWADVVDNSDLWLPNYEYRIKPDFEVGTKFVLNRTYKKTVFTVTEIEDELVYIGWDGIDNRTYYDYSEVSSKFKNKIWIEYTFLEEKPTLKDNDIAIIERLHDTLLDNHCYELNSKLLSDSRELCKRIQGIIEKGAN